MIALCPLCHRSDKVLEVKLLADKSSAKTVAILDAVITATRSGTGGIPDCPNRKYFSRSLRDAYFESIRIWVDLYEGEHRVLFTLLLLLFSLSWCFSLGLGLLLFTEKEVLGGALFTIGGLVFLIPVIVLRQIRKYYVTRVKEHWKQVRYCERCNIFFLPKNSSFAPPEEIRRLLIRGK